MINRKIEWSIDAKNDLLDILDFYIERNKSKTYTDYLSKCALKIKHVDNVSALTIVNI